jgi:predicted flavoprotein YhiN
MERPEIAIDFKPGLTEARLIEKLGPAKRNLLAEAKQRWRLGDGAESILDHHAERDSWTTPGAMARAVKHCRIALRGPRPIAEAISSAGGVRWSELDDALMIARLPGVFVAGEMIDWEAPTGGYLMQGAFATGTHAARGALAWLERRKFA